MDGGEEGSGVFSVSCGNAAPSFQVQEGIFDQVSGLIQIFIIRPLNTTVFLRRDYGLHALSFCLIKNSIAVIVFVRNQLIGMKPLDQVASLRAIRSGTFRDNNSERHTMRIHGQMYLCVEPPFVRLMS
ncbi:hypothetical protein SAMN05421755_10929 [Nitrosomonas sp. Nm33]|nr:hypothetical protein SAMN05421755_10929 [Nitrosomonas sp. Nm33]